MQGRQTAKDFLSYDLNPVPLKDKVPIRKDWGSNMTPESIDEYHFDEIGICTGIPSGGLEAIDFDLKYAEEGNKIMSEYQAKVGGELISKLVIQATQNGGFHILYRCSELEGNRILARNSDGEVLIETRGDGGYIKCYPSAGYKMIRGSFEDIPIISPVERNRLLAAAYRFDEEIYVRQKKSLDNDKSKFPKYDDDAEVGINLLIKHGWTEFSRDGDWIEFCRPGKSDGMSGGYNLEKNFFYVFSTSTAFKERQPYNNVGIYAVLECEGDFRVAYARLAEQGFGSQKKKNDKTQNFEQSVESLSFVSTREEEADYLNQAIENKIAQGYITGWKALDEYFRLKKNTLNFGLGYDGVGKSLMMLHMAVASQILHCWDWGMVLPENKTAMSRRRLLEAYSGQRIDHMNRNPRPFERMKKSAYEHFHIVSNKKHYTLKEVMLMGKRLFEYYGIEGLLVDPYNFFKVEGQGYSWNNEILSELRVFAEEYCSVYVMAHPSSESPRKNKNNDGYLQPPSSYDIQGGADFPYRVDDFFVLHRIKNHPDKDIQKTMEFIVHKIKETETGGKVHPKGESTELMWDVRDNFMGYWDEYGNNPMYDARKGLIHEFKPEIIDTKPDLLLHL